MSGPQYRSGTGWGARLLVGLSLVILGAAAATWGLAHYSTAARFVGINGSRPARVAILPEQTGTLPAKNLSATPVQSGDDQRIADLESRLRRVEVASERAEGSAGRADNLVVAFAARRAIDRGVALGYLERLLVERFGSRHPQAVAAIVTGARRPVRLNDLIAQYDQLGPQLRTGSADQDWWAGFKRELGSLVQVRNANVPSTAPDARYERTARMLQSGDVDRALAETMRMPGARNANQWIGDARRFVIIHRALDEVESAALMPEPAAD
jgi:hypothetical protein